MKATFFALAKLIKVVHEDAQYKVPTINQQYNLFVVTFLDRRRNGLSHVRMRNKNKNQSMRGFGNEVHRKLVRFKTFSG